MHDPIRTDVDLKPLNSFGLAARAREVFVLSNLMQQEHALDWLDAHPGALILGGGSNVLLESAQVDAVLLIQLSGRQLIATSAEHRTIEVAAGENWDELVQWTLAQQWSGLENLSAIPGSVGAAPVQNIGAYGIEISEITSAVQVLNRSDRRLQWLSASACDFSYRNSRFKREPEQWLITAVRLELPIVERLRLAYGDVRNELAQLGIDKPNSADASLAIRRIRGRRLPDPAQLGNAGSFFKNPVVDKACAARLAIEYPELPQYAHPLGDHTMVKLSAAWMIDHAGWKGYRDGDVGVHDRHALVLVNHGSATGKKISALAQHITRSIYKKFGVTLDPEPRIVRCA